MRLFFLFLSTDFTNPFVIGVDHTTEGGLDTYVTPISIPNLPDNSGESCLMSNHTAFPSTSSNHDSLPSNSTMLSNFVPIVVPNHSAGPPPTRKSTRVQKTPVYLQDYACIATTASPSSVTSFHASGSPYDISACLTYSHLDPTYLSYVMTISDSHSTP